MVELCELNIIDQGLECQWPSDIDQHIAQLEFEHSTDLEDDDDDLDDDEDDDDDDDLDDLDDDLNGDVDLDGGDGGGRGGNGGRGGRRRNDNSANGDDTEEEDGTDDGGGGRGILCDHIGGANSLFSSMALEPSIISTDSLDMEKLHARCEVNKNDYKLTFEESGQWGSGGTPAGAATTPATKVAAAIATGATIAATAATTANLTTWGRIQSAEPPPLDDKSNSLPELSAAAYRQHRLPLTTNATASNDANNAATTLSDQPYRSPYHAYQPYHYRITATGGGTGTGGAGGLFGALNGPEFGIGTEFGAQRRQPSSLLATFVERQPDYEYSELYVGNGRYVDVNDNEIGFVPHSTAALQSADRWRAANRLPANPPSKPRRTFADFVHPESLSPSSRAPQLDFMAMQHQMPSLCQSSLSLDEIMVKWRDNNNKEAMVDDERLDLSLLSVLHKGTAGAVGPDSGLGSSASASSGPSHIEDWPSLAILLPRQVVEACLFFKANSRLLSGSNNIERSGGTKKQARNEACRTCFSVRRHLHPPLWAQPATARHILCDCTSSEIIERSYCSVREEERNCASNRLKLHAQELSIVGLPIYDAKRLLVERVVEGVAEIARGNSASCLCTAMEALIVDGLRDEHPWRMIVTVTKPGPATNKVYELVEELDSSEKSLNSRVSTFFNELLRMGSMDCWVCYVVLKENVLRQLYMDGAFMRQASSAYRSLMWRLVENLELLTLLLHKRYIDTNAGYSHYHTGNANINNGGGAVAEGQGDWAGGQGDSSGGSGSGSGGDSSGDSSGKMRASRLASDSRVPKSSSLPARLHTAAATTGGATGATATGATATGATTTTTSGSVSVVSVSESVSASYSPPSAVRSPSVRSVGSPPGSPPGSSSASASPSRPTSLSATVGAGAVAGAETGSEPGPRARAGLGTPPAGSRSRSRSGSGPEVPVGSGSEVPVGTAAAVGPPAATGAAGGHSSGGSSNATSEHSLRRSRIPTLRERPHESWRRHHGHGHGHHGHEHGHHYGHHYGQPEDGRHAISATATPYSSAAAAAAGSGSGSGSGGSSSSGGDGDGDGYSRGGSRASAGVGGGVGGGSETGLGLGLATLRETTTTRTTTRGTRAPSMGSPTGITSTSANGTMKPSGSLASAINDLDEPGLLAVTRGERLRLLTSTKRGPLVRCCRLKARHDRVLQGLLPASNLDIVQR